MKCLGRELTFQRLGRVGDTSHYRLSSRSRGEEEVGSEVGSFGLLVTAGYWGGVASRWHGEAAADGYGIPRPPSLAWGRGGRAATSLG